MLAVHSKRSRIDVWFLLKDWKTSAQLGELLRLVERVSLMIEKDRLRWFRLVDALCDDGGR